MTDEIKEPPRTKTDPGKPARATPLQIVARMVRVDTTQPRFLEAVT
jgi:hypothetical protein